MDLWWHGGAFSLFCQMVTVGFGDPKIVVTGANAGGRSGPGWRGRGEVFAGAGGPGAGVAGRYREPVMARFGDDGVPGLWLLG